MTSLIVFLEELKVTCIIGELPHERSSEQSLSINITYSPLQLQAMHSDLLEETIDYTKVAATCRQIAHEGRFHLIEALGAAIARTLLAEFPLVWVEVTIYKPLPLHHVKASGVKVRMERNEP